MQLWIFNLHLTSFCFQPPFPIFQRESVSYPPNLKNKEWQEKGFWEHHKSLDNIPSGVNHHAPCSVDLWPHLVFLVGMLASSHGISTGPVMFSICRLGTSHPRMSPGFCLTVSRAQAGGTTEWQLPSSSVSAVCSSRTKQDFAEVSKRNLLERKSLVKKTWNTFPHRLSSFPLPHIFELRQISSVTFSEKLFLTAPHQVKDLFHPALCHHYSFLFLSLPLDCNLFKGEQALYPLKLILYSVFPFREWFGSLEKKNEYFLLVFNKSVGIKYGQSCHYKNELVKTFFPFIKS